MQEIQKICVITNGCPENRNDGAGIEMFFKENNYQLTDNFKNADLILFNACALTNVSERLSIRVIKRIQKKKKNNAQLIVFGCLPKINKGVLDGVYQGVTFGSDETKYLEKVYKKPGHPANFQSSYLIPFLGISFIDKLRVHYESLFSLFTLKEFLLKYPDTFNPNTFCIKIASGCMYNCAYCAAKLSRGKIRSRSLKQIIKEFKKGLAEGCRDFALIGTEIGFYGWELNLNLIILLNKLIEFNGNYQIKLRNFHPGFLIDMLPKLKSILKTGKISFISSSFQSGSNKILKSMGRGYNIEDFKYAINDINSQFPKIEVCTQVMAGFPGETEEDFKASLKVLDELNFDYVEPFLFQCRPGTPAEKMKGHISKKNAKRRFRQLIFKSITVEKRSKKNRKFTADLLW
ncbi:MAG: radical SAM protein [Candidatus Aminicenantes bacterium]|nr:radical SAM protein [Candidatus Aminicenantes bacterium]